MPRVALVSAALCAFGLWVLVPQLRRHAILDRPTERSSHYVPTPRGGGVAVVLAISGAVGLFAASRSTLTVVACMVLAAGVGLTEDLHGLPILGRLVAQSAVGVGLVWNLFASTSAIRLGASLLLVVFVVATINAVNFMDGINGISAATGLVGGVTYFAVARHLDNDAVAVLGLAIAASCAAFAPWNVPRARVFLGDVGSYGLGAALAGCAVATLALGAPLEAAVAPLGLYLADTGTVLVGRLARRESLGKPHRQHTYQRLIDTGWSHATVSAIVLLVTAVISALGLVSLSHRGWPRAIADVAGLLVMAAYLLAPSRRTSRVPA